MRTRGFVALVAAGLLIAGCGSSAKTGSGAPAAPTTTTIATAPNTPKQLAADKATAKAAVLRLGDLPAGYKQTPPDPSSDDDVPQAVLAKFAACAYIPKEQAAKLFDEDHGPQA